MRASPCLALLCATLRLLICFFLNATSPTELYTLSLHDALPIFAMSLPSWRLLPRADHANHSPARNISAPPQRRPRSSSDRKSTRLNSSHVEISYAVFCLKKKKSLQSFLHQKDETSATVDAGSIIHSACVRVHALHYCVLLSDYLYVFF